ncbi:MAG: hypothetical protein IPL71_21335 [Anaerolineales bacterium]|nr:hypothetical protein [Anaerolineales bacterium]
MRARIIARCAAVSWANSTLAENINGVRVVQAFSRQEHNYLNFKNYINRYFYETSLDAAKVASVYTPVVDVLGAVATAVVVYVGGTAVLGESITPGVLIAFVLYVDRFFEPIRDLSRRFGIPYSPQWRADGSSLCSRPRSKFGTQRMQKRWEAITGGVRI